MYINCSKINRQGTFNSDVSFDTSLRILAPNNYIKIVGGWQINYYIIITYLKQIIFIFMNITSKIKLIVYNLRSPNAYFCIICSQVL